MQDKYPNKRAVIMGATSGLGYETAKILLQKGWQVAVAGRREDKLKELYQIDPDKVVYMAIDVNDADAGEKLLQLIENNGGMDLYFHSSGIGFQNLDLEPDIEIRTVQTNTVGFVALITEAYNYFKKQKKGHIAAITSVAGTKGIGLAPAYSATKRFQYIYLESLVQLSRTEKANISFTDIRPGFVRTDILNKEKHYPMLMEPYPVALSIVKAIETKKRIAVIDWRYKILVFLWRLIPQSLWINLPISPKRK